jgi:predicted amidohydrolase YtcJ
MGPLKIISDGSLNTRTAYCNEPYACRESLEFPRGKLNYSPEELTELVARAREGGLRAAVHAIGDAAVSIALDAFGASGAVGSIEHAQLVVPADVRRMGRLGIPASVQPAHLLDDRDLTHRCWPDRADRCFPFRAMAEAAVRLLMGSDAPVARLDPWLAMAAAVHRSGDEREPWNPAQSLTAQEALAASTDGQGTVGVGSRGDLVLLDDDRGLQPEENVVPLVSSRAAERYGAPLVDAVNRVSARLTTNSLRFLNWRTAIAGRDVGDEARGWLARQAE